MKYSHDEINEAVSRVIGDGDMTAEQQESVDQFMTNPQLITSLEEVSSSGQHLPSPYALLLPFTLGFWAGVEVERGREGRQPASESQAA